jgi:hypothetical protein
MKKKTIITTSIIGLATISCITAFALTNQETKHTTTKSTPEKHITYKKVKNVPSNKTEKTTTNKDTQNKQPKKENSLQNDINLKKVEQTTENKSETPVVSQEKNNESNIDVTKQTPPINAQAKNVKSVETTPQFNSSSVSATTQYSHTEKGHQQGQVYAINSSVPLTVQNSDNTMTISGNISRGNIGLEKGSIVLSYQLIFDNNGNYISGSVTSSGYVSAQINLVPGQNYIGKSVNFLTSSTGRAGSGSLIYQIQGNLFLQ